MLEPAVLVSFVPAVLAIVATPGPDSIYTLTQSLREGRTAGVVAGAGTATGVLVHTAAAVVGLAALLRTTPDAYLVVTYVGAAYLVYLGVQLIRAEGTFTLRDSIAGETRSLARSYRQAVTINVSNPQVALFVLAFFPQFVPPAANAPAQLSLLGAVYAGVSLLYLVIVAALAGRARHFLLESDRSRRAIRYLSGSVLIAFGLRLAASGAAIA